MGRFLKYALLVATALLCVSAQPLRADTVDQFTYIAGGNTFFWELPSSPDPSSLLASVNGDHFEVAANLTENAGPSLLADITFFSDLIPGNGGLEINVAGTDLAFSLGDVQIYSGPASGPEQAPTFLPLTNAPLQDLVVDPNGGAFGTLTITEVQVAPVPEPSTLVLLGSGLLVVGLGLAIKKASS